MKIQGYSERMINNFYDLKFMTERISQIYHLPCIFWRIVPEDVEFQKIAFYHYEIIIYSEKLWALFQLILRFWKSTGNKAFNPHAPVAQKID